MHGAGYCECGCDERTALATRTDAGRGWRKGEPLRFIRGHNVYRAVLPGELRVVDDERRAA